MYCISYLAWLPKGHWQVPRSERQSWTGMLGIALSCLPSCGVDGSEGVQGAGI